MKWKSNAKFGTLAEDGTIFWLKDYGVTLCIHKIHGLGGEWFLTCRVLGFDDEELNTGVFDKAVEYAKELIKKRLALLQETFGAFVEDSSANEFVRH